jgi:pimeloyl-ACP methyl ester carboxylesterase
MKELGYERLAAQGGDWGADVTTLLALRHPERVIEIHLNSIPPYEPYP